MRLEKIRIACALTLRTCSTRSAPHFYERTTSAERVMNVATTSEELGEHKEKRWCETESDEELKREGEVYM